MDENLVTDVEEDVEEYIAVDRSYALSEAAELLSICALEAYDRKDIDRMLQVSNGWMALANNMENDEPVSSNVRSIGFALERESE